MGKISSERNKNVESLLKGQNFPYQCKNTPTN